MVEVLKRPEGFGRETRSLAMKPYFHLAYIFLALGALIPALMSMTPYV